MRVSQWLLRHGSGAHGGNISACTEYSLLSPFPTIVTFTRFDGGGGAATTGAGGAVPAAPARELSDDFQRDCLGDFRLFFSFTGNLVDRKHLYVPQQNVGIALTLARYFVSDYDDIDEIAGQDEVGNATDVIDPHRHRAFAFL
jgi:hypothetical protein